MLGTHKLGSQTQGEALDGGRGHSAPVTFHPSVPVNTTSHLNQARIVCPKCRLDLQQGVITSGRGNPVRDGCCKHAHTGSRETKTKQPTQGTRRPRQIGHTIGMPATIQDRAEAACENLKGPKAGAP